MQDSAVTDELGAAEEDHQNLDIRLAAHGDGVTDGGAPMAVAGCTIFLDRDWKGDHLPPGCVHRWRAEGVVGRAIGAVACCGHMEAGPLVVLPGSLERRCVGVEPLVVGVAAVALADRKRIGNKCSFPGATGLACADAGAAGRGGCGARDDSR